MFVKELAGVVMYEVTVHFYRKDTFLAKLIRFFGGTRFEHCELSYNGKTLYAHPAVGVQIRDSCTFNPTVSITLTMPQEPTLVADDDYDLIGAALSPFRWALHDKDRYCSMRIATTLKDSGGYYGPLSVTPGHLYEELTK